MSPFYAHVLSVVPQEFRYYSRNDFANALDQYNKARRSPIAFDEFIAVRIYPTGKKPCSHLPESPSLLLKTNFLAIWL